MTVNGSQKGGVPIVPAPLDVKKSPTRGVGFAGRATQEAAGEASPTTSNALEGLQSGFFPPGFAIFGAVAYPVWTRPIERQPPAQAELSEPDLSTGLLSASTFAVSFASSWSAHVRVC